MGVGIQDVVLTAEASDRRIRILGVQPERVTVRLEQRKEKRVPVRVSLGGSPSFGYRYRSPQVLPDQVTIIGPDSKVDAVDAVWVSVELDAARTTLTVTRRPVPRDTRGQDVTGVQLDPPTIQVTVPVEQVLTTKDVPIRVTLSGQPARGHFVSLYRAQPASATIIGPPEELDKVTTIATDPVNIEGATAPVNVTVGLQQPPNVTISGLTQVQVTVEIRAIAASAVTRVAVSVANLGPELQAVLMPESVAVLLGGPAPVLESLQPGSVIVSLNLSGLGPGTYTLAPVVNAPAQVTVAGVTPTEIRVEIRPVATPVPTPSPPPAATPSPPAPTPAPSPPPAKS